MLEETETKVPILRTRGKADEEVNVLDGRTRVMVHPDEVGNAYALFEQTIPAGKGPPMHVHRHETEIFYVVEGEFELFIGAETVRAGPGAVMVGPRDIPHTFRNVGDTPGILHLTVIPGNFGHYFIEVTDVADHDTDAIRKLLDKYDVALV